MEVTPYPHPNYPRVTFWDLPGISIEHVGFEKYDFFIIISDTRFRENDVKLAQEIKRMGKNFYFSKIEDALRAEEKSQREFSTEKTLARIKENCVQGLQKHGVEDPQVFLVSSFELHLFDFNLLQETLERELPTHKKNVLLVCWKCVLLFAMPNINWEIINKKKQAFQYKIICSYICSLISCTIFRLFFIQYVDLKVLVSVVNKFLYGLDVFSLDRLAERTGVPLSELIDVLKSPLAAKKFNTDVMLRVLSQIATITALTVAEEGSTFIPIFGIGIAMTLSSVTAHKTLTFFLNMLAEDAQRVFTRALCLNTSV